MRFSIQQANSQFLKRAFSVYVALFLALFLPSKIQAEGECCKGRLEIAPVFLRLELLDQYVPVKKMTLYGLKWDAVWISERGYAVKPNVLFATGNDSSLCAANVGFGRCLPVNDCLIFVPNIGIGGSYVTTLIDIPAFGLEDLGEKFVAIAPYVGLELIFNLTNNLRFSALFQYAFSWSRTTVEDFPTTTQKTSGPNLGFQIERDLKNKWSVNFGVGYNYSLSKDNSGLRAKGAKLGIVKWF